MECHLNDEMTSEWVGRIDLTLWMRGTEPLWNDDQMTGWGRNERFFRSQIFCSLPRAPSFPPHPVTPPHPWMTRNENHNGEISFKSFSSHFHFIPSSLVIREWLGMTEWWWNEGYFWSKAKPLIRKSPSFCLHSVIPYQYPLLHKIIQFIWGSFPVIIWFNHCRIICVSSHHSSVIYPSKQGGLSLASLRLSVKSIHPPPSAEGVGWIDLTLKRKLASDRPPCFEG